MVEKFGKCWVLLIFQVDFITVLTDGIVVYFFTCERFPGSTLIICLITTKYFTTKILILKTGLPSPFLGI